MKTTTRASEPPPSVGSPGRSRPFGESVTIPSMLHVPPKSQRETIATKQKDPLEPALDPLERRETDAPAIASDVREERRNTSPLPIIHIYIYPHLFLPCFMSLMPFPSHHLARLRVRIILAGGLLLLLLLPLQRQRRNDKAVGAVDAAPLDHLAVQKQRWVLPLVQQHACGSEMLANAPWSVGAKHIALMSTTRRPTVSTMQPRAHVLRRRGCPDVIGGTNGAAPLCLVTPTTSSMSSGSIPSRRLP
jgi:hypothetical protein